MFNTLKIWLSYINVKNGKPDTVVFKERFTNSHLTAEVHLEHQEYQRLKLSLVPASGLEINRLEVVIDFPFAKNHRIFVNGYQSWTDSREFMPHEKLKGISILAKPIMEQYQLKKYGDYIFRKYPKRQGIFHGYTYSYIRDGAKFWLLGSLTERSGFTMITEDIKRQKIFITKECSGLQINQCYDALDLVWIEGTVDDVFDTYFRLMNLPGTKPPPATGWTSWYNYYQNIDEPIIQENLENFDKPSTKIDFFQIDDGWQAAVGDWFSIDKSKFPRGMASIAAAIKAKGYKAGLWLAPFVCETCSDLFREKQDWVLKDAAGKPVLAGFNWSRFYALDLYHPEVQTYLTKVFQMVLDDWGYDLVKLDFLYAVCLLPRKNRTRGQIMTEAMEFLRKCAGDKLILGCGVPLGPAFGNVDYCRIGPDVTLDWDDHFLVRVLANRERDSTMIAIRNAISRRHLNQRAFVNDPDVFLLRNDNIKLTPAQRKTMALVDHLFGGLLFTSDNIGKYDNEQNAWLERIFRLQPIAFQLVESHPSGLVEVIYSDEEAKRLVIINLSRHKQVLRHQYGPITELSFAVEKITGELAGKIIVEPFESRIFNIISS